MFVLAHSGGYWALKAAARSYTNRLYYSRMETEYYDRIYDTELDLFIDDMNDYIRTRMASENLSKVKMLNPIRYTYPMTSLFLCIKRVMESLVLITHITNDREKDNFMNKLCNDMRRGNVETKDLDSVYETIVKFLRLY